MVPESTSPHSTPLKRVYWSLVGTGVIVGTGDGSGLAVGIDDVGSGDGTGVGASEGVREIVGAEVVGMMVGKSEIVGTGVGRDVGM